MTVEFRLPVTALSADDDVELPLMSDYDLLKNINRNLLLLFK
jgi:hypothetical protein